MAINLYNSLTRKLEEFKPMKKTIGMYTCGPTVYNYAHIGNLRTYIFEDILKRTLLANNRKVNHIMNITDVGHLVSDADSGEDKMEKGAAREGKSAWDIAKFYEKAFLNDLKHLNILPANKTPRATDHIKGQIDLIKKLEKKGFTYQTSDGIYFDTSKFPKYGEMALLSGQKLEAGARVDMGEKKHATDFALWKFSPAGQKRQMEWKSPWGTGFPGWHIECSVMSVKYLGQPFDIHCGGIDHIPIHHTNEIAQSEAAFDKPLANYWLHGEFLVIGKDKMAKSGDNFITLQTLDEKNINPLAYRYFVLQAHYRKQLTFSWEALEAAQTGLERLYRAALKLKKDKVSIDKKESQNIFLEIQAKLNNDLDTAGAVGQIWEKINAGKIDFKTIISIDEIMGLDIKNAVAKLEKEEKNFKLDDNATKLAKDRDEARKNKNWAESDKLRKELETLGYIVEDTKEGTKIRKS